MSIAAEILARMVERAPSGRHDACVWGCGQMRDNGLLPVEVETVLADYVAQIPQDDGGYNLRRATQTWRSISKAPAREPWPDNKPRQQKQRQTPRPIRRPEPVPDPEQVARFDQMIRTVTTFADSPAARYLESRGIPNDLARGCGVKYAAKWGDRVGESVVFPIRNAVGTPIAAQGRPLKGKDFDTAGPKSFGVFATIGALDADPVGITEAPIDALSLARVGLPAVAICGASGLPVWLCKLFAERRLDDGVPCSRTIYVATDADPRGDDAATEIMAQLSRYGGTIHRLRPEAAKDWNEVLTLHGWDVLEDQLIDAGVVTLRRPDPRPDLTEDSAQWMRLLRLTEHYEQLYVALHGLRCEGARLDNGVIVGDHSELTPHSKVLEIVLAQL